MADFSHSRTESDAVVITGIGVVCPLATGVASLVEALARGGSAIRREPSLAFGDGAVPLVAAVRDFDPKAILGQTRGLRLLDRATLLSLCAASLALDHAELPKSDLGEKTGVFFASTMGVMESRAHHCAELFKSGPRGLNPGKLANTLAHTPAAHVAIRHGIRGVLSTLSAGACGGLVAAADAIDEIARRRLDRALVGAVESLSSWTVATPESGEAPGEASCVLVLEREDVALDRGALPLARICGLREIQTKVEEDVSDLSALEKAAGMMPGELDGISRIWSDPSPMELSATDRSENVCLPQRLGDCLSVAGLLRIASAAAALPCASASGSCFPRSGVVVREGSHRVAACLLELFQDQRRLAQPKES